MLLACLAGLAAGALWGLTFIAPHVIAAAAPGELVITRFAVYGAISVIVLWRLGFNPLARLSGRDWLRLIGLGALGNTLYYLLVVVSVAKGSPGLTALIIGTLPVMFAVTGNLLEPKAPWPRLALALAPIGAGLLLLGQHEGAGSALAFSWTGAALAAAAMASWLAYGLLNARHLRRDRQTSALLWAALVGIGTAITLPLIWIAACLQSGPPFGADATNLMPLLLAGIILGVFSSWLATWLWNIASARIPAAALGYLIVSETLFALLYAFALDARLPSMTELASLALLVGGTLAGLRVTRT